MPIMDKNLNLNGNCIIEVARPSDWTYDVYVEWVLVPYFQFASADYFWVGLSFIGILIGTLHITTTCRQIDGSEVGGLDLSTIIRALMAMIDSSKSSSFDQSWLIKYYKDVTNLLIGMSWLMSTASYLQSRGSASQWMPSVPNLLAASYLILRFRILRISADLDHDQFRRCLRRRLRNSCNSRSANSKYDEPP
jgi:hypothetical protein